MGNQTRGDTMAENMMMNVDQYPMTNGGTSPLGDLGAAGIATVPAEEEHLLTPGTSPKVTPKVTPKVCSGKPANLDEIKATLNVEKALGVIETTALKALPLLGMDVEEQDKDAANDPAPVESGVVISESSSKMNVGAADGTRKEFFDDLQVERNARLELQKRYAELEEELRKARQGKELPCGTEKAHKEIVPCTLAICEELPVHRRNATGECNGCDLKKAVTDVLCEFVADRTNRTRIAGQIVDAVVHYVSNPPGKSGKALYAKPAPSSRIGYVGNPDEKDMDKLIKMVEHVARAFCTYSKQGISSAAVVVSIMNLMLWNPHNHLSADEFWTNLDGLVMSKAQILVLEKNAQFYQKKAEQHMQEGGGDQDIEEDLVVTSGDVQNGSTAPHLAITDGTPKATTAKKKKGSGSKLLQAAKATPMAQQWYAKCKHDEVGTKKARVAEEK